MKRRVLPPAILFASLVVMVALHYLLPAKRLIGFPWTVLGAIPLLAGVLLNLAADRALKTHGTTVKPFEESSVLVTGGVYAISRHPMYLGFMLVLIGVALSMGSLTPFAVIPPFAVLMECVFIRVEEGMLEEKFGRYWLAYKVRVGRWL